jgi:intraflagellar transport protein 52
VLEEFTCYSFSILFISFQKRVVAFDSSKGEDNHPGSTYKKFYRLIRSKQCKTVLHTEDLTSDKMKDYDVLVLACPKEDFTDDEIESLKAYLEAGKSIAYFAAEGEDSAMLSNVNKFLEDYGMKYENDCVVRTSYYKYLHPKHAFISCGVMHESLMTSRTNIKSTSNIKYDINEDMEELKIVYPNGCTIDVEAPSVPILSSSATSFPVNRPIAGAWEGESSPSTDRDKKRGRIVLVGSSNMFADEWVDKEDNMKVLEKIFSFLLHEKGVTFDRANMIKGKTVDEPRTVPHIEALSERLKGCLQRSKPLPQDLGELLCDDMVSFDTRLIPKVVEMYKTLGVKHEQLTLIRPEFERPIPPLRPAVFPPRLLELPGPALEQFDLDEEFADPMYRLGRLKNKCRGEEDLEYFVQEAGSIIGLVDTDESDINPKAVLYKLVQRVSDFCISICVVSESHSLKKSNIVNR